MILIIAEKSIAGERIAQVLSDSPVKMSARGYAKLFSFVRDGKDHAVLPLRGHIVEVDFPKKFSSWRGTDLQELAHAPIDYNPSDPAIASLLREMGKKATKVILATDADREGESIGVEALRILQETNPSVKVERAYFSAMTPKELKKSFAELTKVDYNLSDSADSRREIDLVWGAVLTRFVSLMGNRAGKDFISVGRVQTPVLALIVNREKERLAFVVQSYWEILAQCEKNAQHFESHHKKGKIFDEKEAQTILAKVKDEKKALIKSVTKKKRMLARPIPFDTTTMLRAASALGFTAGQAMNTAESLYMAGYISYPRTDNQTYPASMNLQEHLEELRSDKQYAPFVEQILAKPLNPSRGKKNTTDHPPVHPTKVPIRGRIGDREWKFFDLVARRYLATFMDEAETENTSIELDIKGEPFAATGQTILKPGWKAAYPFSQLQETILPALVEGEWVNIAKITMPKKETQPPARYSQSALLKLMEENNLGTKATRAETIQKLYARKYISGIKSIEPNQIAFAVIDSLERHCNIVTQPQMTANLETEMDLVAEGKKAKPVVVESSRQKLDTVLEKLLAHKIDISVELKKAFVQQDVLATCPQDQGDLVVRKSSKSGKRFLGCANYPNCTQTYPLPQKGSLSALNKNCTQCPHPMILLTGPRYKLEICLNMDCPSKDEWKRKQAAAAANPAAKPAYKPKAAAKPRAPKKYSKKSPPPSKNV